MADSVFDVLSSTQQMQANYEKYKDMFKDSTSDLVNSETFLTLLVAEMTNQDPLEPTSNTEFITQMAQMTQLQYLQDSSTYSQATYAASLVGKTATASKMDGGTLVTKTGVVTDVKKNGDTYNVTIDGVSFDLSKVTQVSETKTETDSDSSAISTGNQLGDMISRASLMIGMYATISTPYNDGVKLDAGIIESIKVSNGEISAVINGASYKLSDITEVKYAPVYDSGSEDTDSADIEQAAQTAALSDDIAQEVVGEIVPDTDDAEDLEDLEYTEENEDIPGAEYI